jgi:azurin
MKYDKIMLDVAAGSKVKLVFNNPDDMLHNVIVVKPGTANEVAQQAIELGLRGEQMAYVPESDEILAHTGLLQPNTTETIYFQVPNEPGRYQYVCTFPAHSATMRGILRVR